MLAERITSRHGQCVEHSTSLRMLRAYVFTQHAWRRVPSARAPAITE